MGTTTTGDDSGLPAQKGLATTAIHINEVSGLQVGDADLDRGLIQVVRQTYPGRGGLVTKQTKGRRRRTVPVIEPLRPHTVASVLWPTG